MTELKNSKILITGGAGFIGSNLADALVEDNEIVVVDDLSMGKIENLPKSDNLHFFEHSITDYQFMSNLLVEWNFDYIFLLAAVASVADTIERPMETHEVNQNANLNILETIRIKHLKIKKLHFASSAAVYGNNPELPKKETSPIEPLSPYAIDKYATERFVIDYGKLYGIPTVVTRFFNVYGPKQNPKSPYSGVLSLIKKSILSNSVFKIHGDGNQTRDFIFVADVVNVLVNLVVSKNTKNVYNVATGSAKSLNQVIEIFSEIYGKKINCQFVEQRKGDIRNSVASIETLSKAINFSPKFNLQAGLIEYKKA